MRYVLGQTISSPPPSWPAGTPPPPQYRPSGGGAWYNDEGNSMLVVQGTLGLAAFGVVTILSSLFRSND